MADGCAQLPGFRESLRLLLEREQYAPIDIAPMFGVSRERIRQLCERFGLRSVEAKRRGLMALRVWDDAANQFRPVSRGDLRAENHRRAVQIRRAAVDGRIAARQAQIVVVAHALRAQRGRAPSLRDVWIAIGGDPLTRDFSPYMIGFWRRSPVRSMRAARVAMLAALDLPLLDMRSLNSGRRPRLSHCKRGHAYTPENTYVHRAGRQCRACKKFLAAMVRHA